MNFKEFRNFLSAQAKLLPKEPMYYRDKAHNRKEMIGKIAVKNGGFELMSLGELEKLVEEIDRE